MMKAGIQKPLLSGAKFMCPQLGRVLCSIVPSPLFPVQWWHGPSPPAVLRAANVGKYLPQAPSDQQDRVSTEHLV